MAFIIITGPSAPAESGRYDSPLVMSHVRISHSLHLPPAFNEQAHWGLMQSSFQNTGRRARQGGALNQEAKKQIPQLACFPPS